MSSVIHHLVLAGDFSPSAPYLPRQFAQDGFIHCTSERDILLQIANRFYRESPGDFLVLVIDPARLTSELRYEPPTHASGDAATADPLAGLMFPHIYGPLNPEAVVAVRAARRATDGTFLEL